MAEAGSDDAAQDGLGLIDPTVARLRRTSPIIVSAVRAAVIITCLAISLQYLLPLIHARSVLPDFTVFWAAGVLALRDANQVYDIAAITAAQAWAVDPVHGPRPFPYPPTALLLFVPFALIPFWIAYVAWLGLSALAFWSAVRRIARGWAVPFSLTAPHVVLVLILGQTTLVVGSLVIWGVTLIRERPIWAGCMLGAAAAIKPQAVLLAPVALVAGAHWKSVGGAVLTAITLGCISLVFGPAAWTYWLSALRSFPEALEVHRIFVFGATPAMAGKTLGLAPNLILLLQITGFAAGVCATWCAFKTDDVLLRLTGLIGGGLLASPYAMRYDLASLVPVFATCLLHRQVTSWLISLPLLALHSVTIVPALIVSLAASFLRDIRSKQSTIQGQDLA